MDARDFAADTEVDVLVVGAGPTGLALAAQLARFGARFRIIDRNLDRARESRALASTGERRTLPLVARYADACNLFDVPDGGATLRRKLDVLARACDAVGRNVEHIEVTLSSRLAPAETADALAHRCDELARLGVEHLVLVTTGPWRPGGDLDVVLEAVEPLRAIA